MKHDISVIDTAGGREPGRRALRRVVAGLLVLLALGATIRAAGAAPITSPSGKTTPASFKHGCLESNGILLEYKHADGAIYLSACHHNKKKSSECDWVKKTCTEFFYPAQTTGVEGFPTGGLVGGSPGTSLDRGEVTDVAPTGGGD